MKNCGARLIQPLSFVEPGLPFVDPADAHRKPPGIRRTCHDAGFGSAYISAHQIGCRRFANRTTAGILLPKGKKMFYHFARICTAALLSATLLFPAKPIAAAETRSITVQSADLNLAKGTDRSVLQQRIAHAVDRICSPDHARTTAEVDASRTCEKIARARAAVQYEAMIARSQAGTKLAGGQKSQTAE